MIMTTPQEARELAEHYADTSLAKSTLRSLASQVEALTAQLDSYAMALNETKAERDTYKKDAEKWASKVMAVVDIYFDGTENPPEHRAYVDGAFPATMNDLRIAIAKGVA